VANEKKLKKNNKLMSKSRKPKANCVEYIYIYDRAAANRLLHMRSLSRLHELLTRGHLELENECLKNMHTKLNNVNLLAEYSNGLRIPNDSGKHVGPASHWMPRVTSGPKHAHAINHLGSYYIIPPTCSLIMYY
jgi:hypothetical protein